VSDGHLDGSADSGSLRVTRTLSIPLAELEWRFTTSGGPGGQHANRSSTRAEVRFDVGASQVLGPRQRRRLVERFGATVTAAAGEHRSQARNRQLALQRLALRIAGGLRPERPRVPTAPSSASRERRLEAKRRRSAIKKERSASRGDDDRS
jgi:ribosome-associated protein